MHGGSTAMTRVRVGDIRQAHGRTWIVIRTYRDRDGAMVVVGDLDSPHVETRLHATVTTWPVVEGRRTER